MNITDQVETPLTATELKRRGRRAGPFLLALDSGDSGQLDCREIVRNVPGRRLVCRGEWRGQTVVIKLYLDGRKYWRRELEGLQALHAADIPAPQVLYAGTADGGTIHVIVLEEITPAATLVSAWVEAGSEARRTALLKQVLGAIADHHNNGLVQQDIHLDNFLLAGERVVTLDGGGIKAAGLKTSLALKPALDNLALFFAQFPLEVDALVDTVLPAYLSRREWDSRELSGRQLRRRAQQRRRWRQRRFLDKVFSNCSAFACDRKWWHNRVYDRTLESAELIKVLIEPDVSLQYPDTRILQQGDDSTLWLSRIGERRIVVKRYNVNGMWQGILRAVRDSGAAVSWRNAHRLVQYGIATARPVALVEERFGPLRGRAWYLSEYVAGETAAVLCEAGEAAETSGSGAVISALASLLQQLERCRICHGNMDASSFILAEHGPVVIDLDAMQEYSSRFVFRRHWRTDMRNFMRNWDACADVAAMFRELLKPG